MSSGVKKPSFSDQKLFFFWPHYTQHVGSYFSDQGLNPQNVRWKHGVLTTELPGRSLSRDVGESPVLQSRGPGMRQNNVLFGNITNCCFKVLNEWVCVCFYNIIFFKETRRQEMETYTLKSSAK